MTELIAAINEVIKYGLQPNLKTEGRNRELEKNLVRIYSYYFDIAFEFDDKDYPQFNKKIDTIRQNVTSNFPEFCFYKKVSDINDIDNSQEDHIGDAIDDLTDIIIDMWEIKWRIENNSLADGLRFFELIFYSHTQQHIIDLLNYMKQNG
ncbi:DUF5063 domain-containing protein [Hymenobacter metallilatus]|uniref:DUF5063 domain-containing protein n=1 Tax=Hymenobacter metallilatus TaxID=2493666 RepID=A0A428JGR6_9BACT|nr:DUF5063 domain-containing protein [Hymenobacter metallilatus]RSK31735.1 DUF5063 domain-containing protein [Hymenobacter metallilatus]